LSQKEVDMRALIARWLAAALVLVGPHLGAQQLTRIERSRGFSMLDVVRQDIEKNYFDSMYGGIDLKAVFDSARARIEAADRLEQVLGAVANATLSLNDSHTAFIPPRLTYGAEYGFGMRFVGDTCRIMSVKPGSDAEAKGVRIGDALLAVGTVPLTRKNLWQFLYAVNAIQPRAGLLLTLQSPRGPPRDVYARSKVIERRRIVDPTSSFDLWEFIREGQNAWEIDAPRYVDVANRIVVSRPGAFYGNNSWIDDLVDRARNREAMVVDLRGNHGGSVNALNRLIGRFYENDLNVATEKLRNKTRPMIAKGAGKDRYAGALVVLVDAESASASEIFARTVQLTNRGKVIGDRTAGAVRESLVYFHTIGAELIISYGASVTISDLVMPDGGELENVGVTPDELLLPTGEDLAAGNDPVLAHALTLLGVPFTPKDAGALRLRR
jgi:C-terminal processing protease CtpA/Prc